MELPLDPMILLSFINMKLRDFYPTLDMLCEDMNIDRAELEKKLLAQLEEDTVLHIEF